MNEKLLALMAKKNQGIELTQDEQDYLDNYSYMVGTIFGQKLNPQNDTSPIDIAYSKIKAGTATPEDVNIFNASNEEYKNREGKYKYDPTISSQFQQQPTQNSFETMFGTTAPSFTQPSINQRGYNTARFLAQGKQPILTSDEKAAATRQRIAEGTATPNEILDYQEWAKTQNEKTGTNTLDVTLGNTMLPQGYKREMGYNQTDVPEGTWNGGSVRFNENGAVTNGITKDNGGQSTATPTTYPYEGNDTKDETKNNVQNRSFAPYIFPGGSDLNTELYTLGRAIGAKDGQKGKVATGIFAGGAAGLDIARNIASGIGYEKMNQYVDDWYRQNKNKVTYTPESQTRNENNQAKEGGIFHTNYFEMGGEQEQMQETPQEQQQPEQSQQNQIQQMMVGIATAIQKGTPPEQIVQALMQQGLDQAQAIQLVQDVMKQMQQEQTPTTRDGKPFNAQPGQQISFMHGGKKVSGKIKEIKNGKVILE